MSEQKLAHTLLVELLAYQFASPVRWIETQDLLFEEIGTERLVEIGPAAILTGIAKRTLDAKYAEKDSARLIRRQALSSAKNASDILYDFGPAVSKVSSKQPSETAGQTPEPASDAPPEPVKPSNVKTPSTTQTAPVVAAADAPIPAIDVLRTLVAHKLKKSFQDVSGEKTIKSLCGGKSVSSMRPAT